MPEPNDMTLKELLEQIEKYADEHDLDCEEGGPRDRCIPCLAEEALKKL